MTTGNLTYARRSQLEASFDGPIPAHRLSEAVRIQRPVSAWRLVRRIAERRARLGAAAAAADPVVQRLLAQLEQCAARDRDSRL